VTYPAFKREYEKDCNPTARLDPVPFPKTVLPEDMIVETEEGRPHIPEEYKVPAIFVQITGIKADMIRKVGVLRGTKLTTENVTIRWLGIQNNRFVGLPTHWVEKNIQVDVREEAKRRGLARLQGERGGVRERFVILPPGDTRQDEPPIDLCNTDIGLNYYCQEMIDNCLLGGFANAICQMIDPGTAQMLLSDWNPFDHITTSRWSACIHHIQKKLSAILGVVVLKKLESGFTLDADDSMPMILQLRGCDGSETHAITVYQGNIYDSASKFVLHKSLNTLNWCCGKYGFESVLKTYVLVVEESTKVASRASPKRHRNRIKKKEKK
jgi:hypothetical protein